ncbi:hypothetical protein VYU27_009775, partial [Nannochloropsis oceanica]
MLLLSTRQAQIPQPRQRYRDQEVCQPTQIQVAARRATALTGGVLRQEKWPVNMEIQQHQIQAQPSHLKKSLPPPLPPLLPLHEAEEEEHAASGSWEEGDNKGGQMDVGTSLNNGGLESDASSLVSTSSSATRGGGREGGREGGRAMPLLWKGCLLKRGSVFLKSWRRRHCELFASELRIWEDDRKLRLEASVPIAATSLVEEAVSLRPNAFNLRTGKQCVSLEAETEEAKMSWMELLQATVSIAREKEEEEDDLLIDEQLREGGGKGGRAGSASSSLLWPSFWRVFEAIDAAEDK